MAKAKIDKKTSLENQLGQLTYQVGKRSEELNKLFAAFQKKLNNDEQLKRLQKESNDVATKLEKFDGK